jgi:hypothetical protein
VERCLACEADRSETLVGRGSRTADRSDQRREMSRCQSASLRRKARRAAGLGGVSAQSEKHAIDPRLGKRPDVSRAASPFSTSPPLKPLGRGEPRPTRLGGTRQTRAATFVICYLLFVIAAKRPASPYQGPRPVGLASEAALHGFRPFPFAAFPAMTAFHCNFPPQRGVLPMKPTILKE